MVEYARVRNAILCNDIRQEINQKYILIGVFTNAIIVSSLPIDLDLALYLEIEPLTVGEANILINLEIDGEPAFDFHLKGNAKELSGTTVPKIPRFVVGLEKECEIAFKIQFGDGVKSEIIRKKVIQGTVPGLPVATMSSG